MGLDSNNRLVGLHKVYYLQDISLHGIRQRLVEHIMKANSRPSRVILSKKSANLLMDIVKSGEVNIYIEHNTSLYPLYSEFNAINELSAMSDTTVEINIHIYRLKISWMPAIEDNKIIFI